MKHILSIVLFFFSIAIFASDQVVNVYNWSNYMPDSVLKQFEHETGIHVNYSIYDSNETMYAKIRSDPHAGYDVIFPSSYYLQRMIKGNLLHQMDKSKLTNWRYLNPLLLNQPFDPHNDYSLPYLWGTTGIAFNSKYIKGDSIQRWSDLWQPQFKNQLLMLNDVREVFSIALIKLGYSVNDTNPEHIKQAYEELVKLLPNIKLFETDAVQSIFIDEDVWIGMLWNGDYFLASQENAGLGYIFPQDGFTYWIDAVAMPKYAPHLENAYKFINFILRPDIAAQISLAEGYSSPIPDAIKLMPLNVRNNPILNPTSALLKRAQIQQDIGDSAELYEKYWEMLKIQGG